MLQEQVTLCKNCLQSQKYWYMLGFMNSLSAEVAAIQKDSARIAEIREELKDELAALRCECDYDAEGDPLRYVKCSHYCPVHDDCECCGERKGVRKDETAMLPNFAGNRSRMAWVCQECFDTCGECGMNPCVCEKSSAAAESDSTDYEFERGYMEHKERER